MKYKLVLRFFMLDNTEIYFIRWIEILETEAIYRMEK